MNKRVDGRRGREGDWW